MGLTLARRRRALWTGRSIGRRAGRVAGPMRLVGITGALAVAGVAIAPSPAGAEDASSYTVKPGDTLWDIAARTNVPAAAIAEANEITNPDLVIAGTRLIIPDAPAASSTSSSGSSTLGSTADKPANDPQRDITKADYKVKSGDTWSSIARRYSMAASQLADANGASTSDPLYAGQTITIPALPPTGSSSSAASGGTYVVVAGDTLSRIAGRHGTTVSALAEANGLAVDGILRIGQTLRLPAGAKAPTSAAPAAAAEVTDIPAGLPRKIRNDPARLSLLPSFRSAAGEFGIPADLLMSVCYLESGWKSGVISYVGAMGLCQLMPDTAADLASWMGEPGLDPWNPIDNLRMSAKYLRVLLDLNGGDSDGALAGYYQGHISVQKNGMYQDTQRYVQIVQANRSMFR